MPSVPLSGTDGALHDLSTLPGISVVYAYPRTSPPDAPPIEGWDAIPGAWGCTPQSCGFRDHHTELLASGAARVFGLSTQQTTYQSEAAARLNLPFVLLSDADLKLAQAVGLETFTAGGMVLLKRVTLIIRDGVIEHFMQPITDPAANARDVIAYLKRQEENA